MKSTQPIVKRLGRWRPDFLKAHAADPEGLPFLLESASTGTRHGRYDLLLMADRRTPPLVLDAHRSLSGPAADAGSFLTALDRWWRTERTESTARELPFTGGWFLYLGYELAEDIETKLRLPIGSTVIAVATRVRVAAIYDHQTGELSLVGEPGTESDLLALAGALQPLEATPPALAPIPGLDLVEEDPERYRQEIGRAHV